jgi:hypothetical protein
MLEGFVITPRIVGDKLGLPAVFVLLALLVFGDLFGFVGVMLALPAAAVLKVFAEHFLARYRASEFFTGVAQAGAGVPARANAAIPHRSAHRHKPRRRGRRSRIERRAWQAPQ